MINFRPLFNPEFWFSQHPIPMMIASTRILVAAFAIFLIIGSVIRMVSKKRHTDYYVKETALKIARLFTTMGFLGLVWLFFAVEQVTFIQARYWMIVWLLGIVVWAVYIIRYVKIDIPKEREMHNQYQERSKYIPGKKKN